MDTKVTKLITISCLSVLLVACTTTQVTSMVGYNGRVPFQSFKIAYLYWHTSHRTAASSTPVILTGMDRAISYAAVNRVGQRREVHAYGQAQQAVFMASLREVLRHSGMFQYAVLATRPPSGFLPNNHVAITLYFKRATIGPRAQGFPITLNVRLSVRAPRRAVFTRNYTVRSAPPNFFTLNAAKARLNSVSRQLMTKIIQGLGQWYAVGSPKGP